MKKIISIAIFICFIFPYPVYANLDDEEEINVEQIKSETIQTAATITEEPKLNSRVALIYDRASRKNLIRKKWPQASTYGQYYENYDCDYSA